jgi:hypothetical protein
MAESAASPHPTHFRDDDDAYLGWLAAYPRGHVINCYREPTRSYLVLHRATCETVRGRPACGETWTCGDYSKVCAADMSTLNRWALEKLNALPTLCPLCRP